MEAKHIQPAQQFSVDHENLLLKVYHRYLDYLDSQAKNHLLWFFLALMIHGVFFLASPAILIWFYDAPILVIAITILTFFTNLVANMGGAGIRTTLTIFFLGLIINFGTILIYIS